MSSIPRTVGGGRFPLVVERALLHHSHQYLKNHNAALSSAAATAGRPSTPSIWISELVMHRLSIKAKPDAPVAVVLPPMDDCFSPLKDTTGGNTTTADTELVSQSLESLPVSMACSKHVRMHRCDAVDEPLLMSMGPKACMELCVPLTLHRRVVGNENVFCELRQRMQAAAQQRDKSSGSNRLLSPIWFPIHIPLELSNRSNVQFDYRQVVSIERQSGPIVSPTLSKVGSVVETPTTCTLSLINAADVVIGALSSQSDITPINLGELLLMAKEPVVIIPPPPSMPRPPLVSDALPSCWFHVELHPCDLFRLKVVRHQRRLRSEFWINERVLLGDEDDGSMRCHQYVQLPKGWKRGGIKEVKARMQRLHQVGEAISPRFVDSHSGKEIDVAGGTRCQVYNLDDVYHVLHDPTPMVVHSASYSRLHSPATHSPHATTSPPTISVRKGPIIEPHRIPPPPPPISSPKGNLAAVSITLEVDANCVVYTPDRHSLVLTANDKSMSVDIMKLKIGARVVSFSRNVGEENKRATTPPPSA